MERFLGIQVCLLYIFGSSAVFNTASRLLMEEYAGLAWVVLRCWTLIMCLSSIVDKNDPEGAGCAVDTIDATSEAPALLSEYIPE